VVCDVETEAYLLTTEDAVDMHLRKLAKRKNIIAGSVRAEKIVRTRKFE
jgi:hypothetical protein